MRMTSKMMHNTGSLSLMLVDSAIVLPAALTLYPLLSFWSRAQALMGLEAECKRKLAEASLFIVSLATSLDLVNAHLLSQVCWFAAVLGSSLTFLQMRCTRSTFWANESIRVKYEQCYFNRTIFIKKVKEMVKYLGGKAKKQFLGFSLDMGGVCKMGPVYWGRKWSLFH